MVSTRELPEDIEARCECSDSNLKGRQEKVVDNNNSGYGSRRNELSLESYFDSRCPIAY